MLGIVSAHIPGNATSNLEQWRSNKRWPNGLVLLSAATLSNICSREYALNVDAIKQHLPSQNNISLTLDWGTSTNKLALTSVTGYYMDRNRSLCEVQLAFDEVDRVFFSPFEN